MTKLDDLIKRLQDPTFVSEVCGPHVRADVAKEAADALQRMKDALEPFAVWNAPVAIKATDFIRARRALRGEGT